MIKHQLITPSSVYIDTTSRSKTAVLLTLSELFSKNIPHLESDALFDAYWKRENMGSTTIGHGIMIPHVRSEAVDSIHGCFLKLQNPVDFGAEDKQPVDLVFGLLVSSPHIHEHLKLLSSIVKLFSDPEFRQRCRTATDEIALYSLVASLS